MAPVSGTVFQPAGRVFLSQKVTEMAPRTKLTAKQVEVIEGHITPMLEGVESALAKLPHRDTVKTGNYVKSQRLYYRHIRAALRWVIETAKQRQEGNNVIGREAI